jgi:pantoate--beta-alanine ligase
VTLGIGGLEVVRTVSDLRAHISDWRELGGTVGLVPTMGGLHEGHLSLVRASLAAAERTVVTLFVNPAQFGEGEDFDDYPRDEAADAGLLAELGAHLLFAPEAGEIYAPGHLTQVSVPSLGECLEGEFRPGFFTGVATVVAKLLIQTLPDAAFFGEKDYQQLRVITRMAKDLDIPTDILSVPTVRDGDGLALSSRNAYLSARERGVAPDLHRIITAVAVAVADGARGAEQTAWGTDELVRAGFDRVDYVAVRDALTLEPVETPLRPARVLAAAWLGRTRLIDNVAV